MDILPQIKNRYVVQATCVFFFAVGRLCNYGNMIVLLYFALYFNPNIYDNMSRPDKYSHLVYHTNIDKYNINFRNLDKFYLISIRVIFTNDNTLT